MVEAVKISVLMSVYNPKDIKYLAQAVRSIIYQTFREWEMILYNDGSDSIHEEAIAEIVAMDDRIRYIRSEKNQGLGHALNIALSQAKGRYIARMDADDISHPQRFQKLYEFLEQHPQYQWAGSNTELIDDKGRWGFRKMPEIPKKEDFLKYSPYIHPSVLFRRQVLEDCNGYIESRRGEDYELFMRLHAAGRQGFNIQEELFQYREDENTYKHRKYRYQMEEVGIRLRGFYRLGILNPKTIVYAIKPMVVGVIPYALLLRIKKRVRKEMYVERYKGSQAETLSGNSAGKS